MKRNSLIFSILTMVLCASLIAGSSFALFTSESKVNVAVTAGTVDVEASISDLELYSPTAIDLNGVITDDKNAATTTTFANGGTATLEDGTLTLTNITPGDKVTFAIGIENKSNVSIKYRTILSCDEDDKELLSALKINIGGAEVVGESAWTALKANGTIESLPCSVELPAAVGNAYQNKSCTITFKIEAVQGNTDDFIGVSDIEALRAAVAKGGDVKLLKDITVEKEDLIYPTDWDKIKCILDIGNDVNIDLNGHSLSYTREDPLDGDALCKGGLYIKGNTTVNIYDSSEDQTGTIELNNNSNNGWTIYAHAATGIPGATVNIWGGNFKSSNECVIYSNKANAHINIYGGKYSSTHSNVTLLLNVKNGQGHIDVYGGSFLKFKPGVTNGSESQVGEGFKVVQDGDWYTVVLDTEVSVTKDTVIDMKGLSFTLANVEEPYVLTSDNSGAKITLKDATYTGEAQGIYFGEYTGSSGKYQFNTQADNVTVKDLKVSTSITNGSNKISAGVWIYGTFELNDCKMSGTTTTQTGYTPYDAVFVNQSKGTVNGGEYGSMFVYTHSEVTLKGVKVGKIACMTNTVIGKALTIDKDCEIDTIEFVGSDGYVMNIVIEDGAQIGSIIYRGTTYTIAQWQAYVASL